LAHTDHDTVVARATNDGGKEGARGIVTGETSHAHTGPGVNDKGSNFVITHF
jgi:hypothetical protein